MLIPFAPPPGLISDDTTFAAEGTWEDGSNVRFWRGKPQTIGGWTAYLDGIQGICRTVLAWTQIDGSPVAAFGTHSHLHAYAGGQLFDITPAGLVQGAKDGIGGPGYGAGAYSDEGYGTPRTNFFARTWSLSNYGQSLIANPRGYGIYWWRNETGVKAALLANAPAAVSYALVTPERQVLAFGCNEQASGNFNPLCIRGSDIENPEVWAMSAANNAFEHILEGGGRIVAAQLVGSYVAVWTDTALHLGQFIGSPGQTYRFDRVAENHGLIAPNAVAIVGQTAFWIGPDFQFRTWSVGGNPQILPCPIRRDFKENLAEAQADKIAAATITQYNEVWWFYPDARDGSENSRYVALNIADGTWFRGRMARTAFVDAGVSGYPVGVTPDGHAFYHEIGNSANGGALEWFIRSADQYIEESGRHMLIRSVRPDFEGQAGAVSLSVAVRKFPQAEAVKKDYALPPGLSKRDMRASGAVIAMCFSGASSPSWMRLGKPVFDAVPTGGR